MTSRLYPNFHIFSSSGNWGVDLQAGSEYGYRLLFVVLLAGIFAAFLQVSVPDLDSGYYHLSTVIGACQ
jgi:hypothetical protein